MTLVYGEAPKVRYTGISRQRFCILKRRKQEEKEIGIGQT
jgi:hypothetical protein